MNRQYFRVAFALAALITGCDGNESSQSKSPRFPLHFQLNATAIAEEDGFTVTCVLDLVVTIHGVVSRTDDVVEYIATMGGGAQRSLLREDGSGVSIFADIFDENRQVLHLLPNRVQLVDGDFPPGSPSSGFRFWDELRFFDGFIDQNSVIRGEWLCAPLDVEQGGMKDDSVFADGTWETVELENGTGQSAKLAE